MTRTPRTGTPTTDATTCREAPAIRWERDADGIVLLTMDDPDQSANTMNAVYTESMGIVVDRLRAELAADARSVTGVVVTSAKKTFFAGGDLNDLMRARPEDAAALTTAFGVIKGQLRRLETLGVPVVAAVNGAALGGGLEIALACHHRIAADVPGSWIGLPEVTLGLLPGAGGVVRTVRMLGVHRALTDVLLRGQRHRPRQAQEAGLVDEVVDTVEELVPRAKEWIRTRSGVVRQPWDTEGYRMPGGTPAEPALAALLPSLPATVRARLGGAPAPAPRAILGAAVEGALVDVDTALEIETRYLVHLATGQIAKNMIKAFFFDLQHVNSVAARCQGGSRPAIRKVAVLGAGPAGAAIAHLTAGAGIEVVLKDSTPQAAERGKAHAVRLKERALAEGRVTPRASEALLERISSTADPADLAGADLVIEAGHGDPRDVRDLAAPDAVLASTHTAPPATGVASGGRQPEDLLGIRFSAPGGTTRLVEIAPGERTSGAAVAKAVAFARLTGGTALVVSGGRGFFTARVLGRFLDEALAALGEGVEPATVEQAGAQAGYLTPPLRLLDEVTLTAHRGFQKESGAAGGAHTPLTAATVVERLLDTYGRDGRFVGAGCYDYDSAGARTGLWPGLRTALTGGGTDVPMTDLKERMLFAPAVEAVRCLDEGVLTSVPEANIGSLHGIGFPSWTGGVVQYVNQYPGGLTAFVTRARALAAAYGPRFDPPSSLVEKANRSETLA
ncbi:enoyl-CoA hydratase-related protein [Streptomyces sp. NPDC127091]|uniref:enoyl-CoA hydratase-related protein n=1 Tax=Streptomyces sp. NPDC127091 TaxID=3347134 RepID=UPI00365240F7